MAQDLGFHVSRRKLGRKSPGRDKTLNLKMDDVRSRLGYRHFEVTG
jgi:hypothetical protein